VLCAIYCFGISVGFVQGQFDPENHNSFWELFSNLSREVQISTFVGMSIGGNAAWIVWLIRTYEKLDGDGSQTPELQIGSLNFDDTEETRSTSSDLFRNSPRKGLWFGADEDEEGMSLIKNKDL